MSQPNSETARRIRGYHAHVYFRNGRERAFALELRRALERLFPAAALGRVHDAPVVLHPEPMYQVAFGPALFAQIVPWLMLERGPLSVLVHPVTGDVLAEHRDWPLWLGAPLELRLDRLESSPRALRA